MSNIKKTLKEAREAINNKDYQTTLKLCKSILKEDKDNYMALVFMGISLQEIGPEEQALLAFKKAIQLNATNILAYNGLANYYEKKNTPASKQELFKLYLTLLQLESNNKKIVDYIEKIIDLGDNIDKDMFISTVQNILTKDDVESIKNTIRFNISSFLASCEDLNENLNLVHAGILKDLIENPNTVSHKYYTHYLKTLYNLADYNKLLEAAEQMQKVYKSDITCLEWICKVYIKLYIDNHELEILYFGKAESASKRLLKESPNSFLGILTEGVLLYKNNKLLDAKELFVMATNVKGGLVSGWMLLATSEHQLGLYEDALESILKADKLYTTTNSSDQGIRNRIDILLPDLLSRSKEETNWKKAVEICLKVDETSKRIDSMTSLIRAYNNLKMFDESQKLLAMLEAAGGKSEYVLLNAHLLKQQDKLKEALVFLTEHPLENSESWLEIGLLYWDLELYDKSLTPFIKATKYNSNSYLCFSSLGRYYYKVNDLEKARRCYEKAFKLNSKCLEIGLELSKIYMKQKKWDANIVMLQNLTDGKATIDNSWALIQLGLSYYDQCDFNKAIDSFRLVIRLNSKNSFCWESLGDAYIARGSYSSALKSYQKAAELNPSSIYPQLQIATVKQILGQLAEGRSDFEILIKENRSYVPALKGIAVTCLNQAKEYQKSQLWGLARDCAQYALDKLTIAIEHGSNISCLWKLTADACYLVANLPEKYCCMFILSALAEGKDVSGSKILEQDELFTLAERCYCKSMSLIEDNVLIWHDLARCYLSHAKHSTNNTINLYQNAFAAAHHCITIDSGNWEHWNLLGIVAFFKEPKNYALAQHAFIKAVTIEKHSAVAWCNLGTLYLHLEEDRLANKAFAQAQRVDPTYVNSWVGQAFVAEQLSPDDAMDLFRHSTQLTVHSQSAIGYGYWVCKTILEAAPHSVIYSIHNMHAVPVACDALTWYTENYPDDACAWNMLGLLRERMGLKMGAAQAFRSALRLAEPTARDKVYMNYGRSLVRVGKYSQAVDMFKNVKEATFNSGSGLALALFKDKQYEESYTSYESALHWLTEDQGFQSELLVALASMAYLFQGPDEAKTLLFQSFQLENPSAWGLYATLSLALVHQDLELADLVLKELEKLKDSVRCLPHYSVLLSYVYLLQGDSKRAVCEVSKLVHRHPSQATLWLSLSILLIRLHAERPRSYAAAKCGEVAMKLGQSNMDVTKVLCIVSLGLFLVGDYEQALNSAQKAIHYYPNVPECWVVLISALIIKLRSDKKFASRVKLGEKVAHVKNMNPPTSLSKWLDDHCTNIGSD
ncbi:Tetratricopeptide repeat [Popillia japonica]|uniref:Tetratricopeptide repeat n=1 Tax=Popillia japonica TaxID=7064 RepID=A0AAW1LQP0_POPJA